MGKKSRIKAERASSDEEVQRLLKNPKVRKALNEEIYRIMEDMLKDVLESNLAATMWSMRQVFGFGAKRLKKWAEVYDEEINELQKHFQMFDTGEGEINFLARRELEKIGVNVEDYIKIKDIL